MLEEVPTKYTASKMDVISQMGHKKCKTEFVYGDFDVLENELGEIYGYYELCSLSYNFDMFHAYMGAKAIGRWSTSKFIEKCNFMHDLLDDLELVEEHKRFDATLAISYLMQGCWKDFETATEQLQCIEESVLLLLQCNGFWRVWKASNYTITHMDIESIQGTLKPNERILESCLNILCTITHVALRKRNDSSVQEFISEIKTVEGDSVLMTVLNAFTSVAQVSSCSFLLKKLVLLARNLILLSAGDWNELRKLKDDCRKAAGLKPCKEDTIRTCCSIDVLQKESCWNSCNDVRNMITLEELREHVKNINDDETETLVASPASPICSSKSLPWAPKSSIDDLRAYTKSDSVHHVQFQFPNPIIIREKMCGLIQYLHVPLSTFHKEEDQLIRKYPKSLANQEKPFVERTEQIFTAMLPSFQALMKSLMAVLDEAAPLLNPVLVYSKRNSVNLPFIPRFDGDLQYFIEDSVRQTEIIVKAISAILILLLKHAKLNHIYQFEYIASKVVAANYLPIVLRIFNRDLSLKLSHFPTFQHPLCPFMAINVDLIASPTRVMQQLSTTGSSGLSWRNTFSHINLLRILNKVVKGKPSRILILRMFNGHHTLKRCLSIKESLFQQYTLKLLKLLFKFLDQEWKRNNQCIISAVYHKVRHRLLENWIGEVASNKMRKRSDDQEKIKKWPWDHNEDEICLNRNLDSFLRRRYGFPEPNKQKDLFSNMMSVTFMEMDLPESFKTNYERWMEQEVIDKNICWDNLVCNLHIV